MSRPQSFSNLSRSRSHARCAVLLAVGACALATATTPLDFGKPTHSSRADATAPSRPTPALIDRWHDGTPPKRSFGPPGPLTLSQPESATADFEWVSPETTFKVDPVECNGVNIGRLDFKYRTYQDNTGGDGGGACLEGGFTANGGDPCFPFGPKPGTEYFWVQTITTNDPLGGHVGEYVDAADPVADPAYPFGSDDTNPAGDAFTSSFYDGPGRGEMNGGDTSWLAELMLCCRSGNKIHVIGSFLWGFGIDSDGDNTDDSTTVTATPRGFWGPATQSGIDTVAEAAKGTKTEQGWTIRAGCCCANWFIPFFCTSDSAGLCTLGIDGSHPQGVLDQVLIFSRNHPAILFNPPAPGWIAQPWGSNIAPPMPYEITGAQMHQQGLLLINTNPHPGPSTYNLQFRLAAHESHFDVFFHNADTNQWIGWVKPTQELLADLNGNGVVDQLDLPTWDLAFTNPSAYATQFPGLNRIYRGDLTHNGVLDPADRNLLFMLLNNSVEHDAQDSELAECPSDIDNNNNTDIDDLVRLITSWNQTSGSEDVNGDGVVNIDDLVLVITNWGDC